MNINDLLKLSRKEMMKIIIKKKINGELTLAQFNKILEWWERHHLPDKPHLPMKDGG